MRNPFKWIAEAISDAWYQLGAWYTVKMWHLFEDGGEAQLAGLKAPLLDHSHELVVRACTRKAGHDGPCNGFPRPGHKVWDEKLGKAVPMALTFPDRPIMPAEPARFDFTDDGFAGKDETAAIDKAIEAGEEYRRERRRVLDRKRYAIAHGKRTFVGFNGVTCRLPKVGKTKASRKRKAR